MSKTIRISDEVEAYIAACGQFGESHDDVLRRQLIGFDGFLTKLEISKATERSEVVE